jgi:opacity protein-like surface antigen
MSKLLASIVFAVILVAAPTARAETRIIAVAPFAGPEEVATEARAVVVQVVGTRYRVLSTGDLEHARAFSESDNSEPSAALTVARLAGADAVVVGQVATSGDAYALSMSVLRAKNGESVGAVLVPLPSAQMTAASRGHISRMVGDLLVSLDASDTPPGQTPPRDQPPAAASGDGRAVAQVRARPVVKERPRWRLPVRFEAAVGLSATARRLSFSQQQGLGGDGSLAANPAPGLHFEGEAATAGEPGLGLAVSLDRSIRGSVALGGSQGFKLPVTQMDWGAGLRGRMRFRRRWVSTAELGYRELKYEVAARPMQLLVPDARYSFLDAGAGLRLELGRAAVYGAASYLITLGTSGITDAASFGSASSYGLEAETGLEVEVIESIFVRLGFHYLRFVLDFDGSGDLAVGLDGDIDQDVIGAVDAYVGGTAQVVFRF